MAAENERNTKFASLVFFAIAIVLVVYGWVPARGSLQEDNAKIVRIVSHPGTRYNVEFVTTRGERLSCIENTLRKWPPDSINRCPVEKFKPFIGKTVHVLHDDKYVYDVHHQDQVILSYSVFRRFQIEMGLIGLLMAGIALLVRRRPDLIRRK